MRLPEGVRRRGRRRRASVAAFETLAFGDLSLLVKCGVQFGLFGGAVLHLGTEQHHERYLRDIATLELPGCFAMTETGHGSNVQAARHDRDLRRGRAGVRRPHARRRRRARTTSATPRATAAWPRCSRSSIVGGEERGVHALLVPIRDERRQRRCHGVHDRGLRRRSSASTASTTAALRFDERPRPARRAARPLRAGLARTATYYEPDREPDQALLHDARHARPGPRQRLRRVDRRDEGRAGHRGAPRARRAASSARPDGDEVVLMDYRTHQRRLLPALATTYAPALRPGAAASSELHDVFTADDDARRPQAARARDARRRR